MQSVSAVGKGATLLMEKLIEVENDPEVAASIELQVLDKICSELDEATLEQSDDDDDDDDGDDGDWWWWW